MSGRPREPLAPIPPGNIPRPPSMGTTIATEASFRTTGEVRLSLGLSERQVGYFLSMHPELNPPLLAGRRLWGEQHVAALRDAITDRKAARAARAATKAKAAGAQP